MAGNVESSKTVHALALENVGGFKPSRLHLLPCRIFARTPTDVARKLVIRQNTGPTILRRYAPAPSSSSSSSSSSSQTAEENVWYQSAFRGRRICGAEVPLPQDFRGLILEHVTKTEPAPEEAPKNEDQGRVLSPGIEHDDPEDETDDEDGDGTPIDFYSSFTRSQPSSAAVSSSFKSVSVVGSFDAITYWNREAPPRLHHDLPSLALRWCGLAPKVLFFFFFFFL